MATVFHAHDPRFERDVAVKVLPKQFTHDPQFRARFEREAKTIAALQHSAIVPVYDFGEQDGIPYLVMRFMDGGSLSDRLHKGPLTLDESARILQQLAPALDEAHSRGIVHRDLKPDNILFDAFGDPYLSDFGIVKVSQQTAELTGAGIIGTPAYMSPEQAKGGEEVDGRSDIYSLGIILFEMLSGQLPYQADTPVQILMQHVLRPVPQIMTVRPDLPTRVEEIISKALAKDPNARFSTARELAGEVRLVADRVASEAPTALPRTILEPAAPPTRHPTPPQPATVAESPATSHRQPATSRQPAQKESRGMAIPAIAGIVIGCVVLGVIAVAGLYFFGDNLVSSPTREVAAATATNSSSGDATTPETTPDDTGDSTPEPDDTDGSGAINNIDDASQAVVRIVAQGTFVDPEVGLQLNAAGSGSGFIIDESGIAVTNNHVVTGAALLEVFVNGETTPRNARVLGVSECSDLAVIDIDGDGFEYLDWYEGSYDVGLEIYTAGYPLGDPEFTLTQGIVSKAQANGETNWASVDRVIEHDARINPGNSGGPLLTEDARVLGINYAAAQSVDQYFAIAHDEAVGIIDQLRAGNDVDSIGINGIAVSDGGDLTGIWVSSVASGSPADNARIRPGDIITTLEGLVLATDGTMSDYCDVLRSRNLTDTMNIEILRFDSGEVLQGQLNGRELEVVVDFGTSLGGEVTDSGTSGYTYTTISDDTGRLSVEVPTAWSDVVGSSWSMDDETVGIAVSAAPDRDAFLNTWTTPGVFFGASEILITRMNEDQMLDDFTFNNSCTYDGREDYSDGLYTGRYDLWSDCGGEDTVFIVISATPEDRSLLILVMIQIIDDNDLDALDHILDSFIVN